MIPKHFNLFIDGKYVAGEGKKSFSSINPADGSVIAEVAEAEPTDVERAVEAAHRAFPAWAATSGEERGKILA